ncbi:NADP-dependent oxidoreductase [Paenibacillus sp. JX-17]|uniref:NADP-dependent oxidoreductase n=1 Tax=Paenibacillus lacisoli TaxID=3064525 RepID=A0ABT9CDU3_9BACL|nr:NADP-dependent oxidoreductase [Paenibacillus sp. JX-17]MDO7906743.1 NADP-dependent oxidoreductase [Paenibacillus sp. JX-17]
MSVNDKIILASRPEGVPSRENFEFVSEPLPQPQAGQALVRTLYLSVDPYMRGRMSDAKSYAPPYAVGDVIRGGAVGQVMESSDPRFAPGDIVSGTWGWQRYAAAETAHLMKVDPADGPISTSLHVVGMTGLTAYFGLLRIGDPQPGETVVVSGAAGAVGMIVGQIAKIKGARVVGIAGTERKVRYLKEELGFDEVIDYKAADNIQAALEQACPNGVDVYFDNVGGEISDAVLHLINRHARIPVCGQISLYNLQDQDVGPRIQPLLLKNTALMKGFLVGDYAAEAEEGRKELAGWVKKGLIQYEENIIEGFENTPDAFIGLFSGDNLGKQLVKVGEITEP